MSTHFMSQPWPQEGATMARPDSVLSTMKTTTAVSC
jgi:hypothetical protein